VRATRLRDANELAHREAKHFTKNTADGNRCVGAETVAGQGHCLAAVYAT